MVKEAMKSEVETHSNLEGQYDSIHFKDMGLVVRFAKPDHKIEPIVKEYEGIGFANLGGKIKKRNASEQMMLIRQCEKAGIFIPRPTAWIQDDQVSINKEIDEEFKAKLIFRLLETTKDQKRSEAVVYPFIPGIALSEFLQEPAKNNRQLQVKLLMVAGQMQDLIKTHRSKIVMGDRWGPNQIVMKNQMENLDLTRPLIAHIDLDLDIRTTDDIKKHDPAMDFEAAQIIYHLAFWTNSREREEIIKKAIAPMWKIYKKNVDSMHFEEMLQGHINYFKMHDKQYSLNESDLLIASLI